MDWIRIGDFLMAHFAELDENNIVTNVIVVHNNELLIDGVELEQKGIDFCVDHFGGRWIQTSYNSSFRFHFAGVGYTWDETREAFISPKCHDEAILNEATTIWDCENEAHYAVS